MILKYASILYFIQIVANNIGLFPHFWIPNMHLSIADKTM
jgi:hypothetical protein